MCGLFGLLDYQRHLSNDQKLNLLNALAIQSEERGTDATGIAYYKGSHLYIQKAPRPAHSMKLRTESSAAFIMGHTRAATQGSAKDNFNNHPFPGYAGGSFALAHNGVLFNDIFLQRSLPVTKVKTDSYVAVQLLQQSGKVNFSAIRNMAEMVDGSFAFTILNRKGIYFVRGSSPLCIYHFPKQGVIAYASTREILEHALKEAGFFAHHKEIHIQPGEILHVDLHGQIQRDHFHLFTDWCSPSIFRLSAADHDLAMLYARSLEMTPAEVETLLAYGFTESDLDEMAFDRQYREECKAMCL